MNVFRTLLGGLAGGAAGVAVRAILRGGKQDPRPSTGADDVEPVLGYDGMDRDTLLDWLDRAELDADTVGRIRRYETERENRAPILARLNEMDAPTAN